MRHLGFVLLTAAFLKAADFKTQIQPLLEQNCTACHGALKQLGAVRLDTPSGFERAQPARVLASLESGAMPPGDRLPAAAIAPFREWVRAGAAWPANTVLTTGGAGSGGADNLALARAIHAKISEKPAPAKMEAYKTTIPNTQVSFEMRPIPAGEFRMGTPEGPTHSVRLDPFWMAAKEVTWDEYRLFMFANQAGEATNKDPRVDAVSRPTRPYMEMSFGMGISGFPAISMTQHAANKYAQWLSAKTGDFYRLPTEAEWEYACRAGSTTAYPWGDDPSQLPDYAWFDDNSDGKYQKGGLKKPNAWGLYDMLGNVMEWTLDQYAPYPTEAVTNPWVKAATPYPHAVRGGSWADTARKLSCGARVPSSPAWKQQDPQLPKSIWYHTDAQGLGFRLVRPLKLPAPDLMYQYWNSGVERDR